MILRHCWPYIAILLLFVSCSTTRYIPDGNYRLKKNVVITDRTVPRKDRIKVSDVDKYIRQSPNRKFLGTDLRLWIYNWSDTAKNNWWNRGLRNLGEEPEVMDVSLVERSAGNIRGYMRSLGYFDSELQYDITTRRKNAVVTYRLTQNEPYRIGQITYDFQDEFLGPMILEDTSRTLLRSGDIFDMNVMNAERSRITDYLKRNGYFDFNVNNISYVADSTLGDRTIDLKILVRQYIKGYSPAGFPEYENNSVYRLSTVYINPDYDPVTSVTDPEYYRNTDTLEYRGLEIIYRGRTKVRPRVLRQAVNLYPNAVYNADEVERAYSNIMRLGYFRSANILFEKDSARGSDNMVTFIGEDEDVVSTETTREQYLLCRINCVPSLKQGYKFDIEGSGATNFYALGATVGYQNRNLFRGAELFDISLTGRYEFVRTRGKTGSGEIGASTSISFPRFITPFNVDPYNRRVNPRTRFELSINNQNRPYYNRTLSSAKFGYSWSNRRYASFALRPIDVNLVKMKNVDNNFINNLGNEYLINSYTSQLVAGISGSFVYNTQLNNLFRNTNSLLFRFNWETMGNLFSGLTRLFTDSKYDADTDMKYYNIFGIRYAQYFRVDASLSQRYVLGEKSSFVYRFFSGGGLSYGNSPSIPIDRLFYSGGTNSMRGWVARTLGPGSVKDRKNTRYPSQVGNFKLEANVEVRFPVSGFLHGAVFLDAGNIWFLRSRESERDGVFFIDQFYKQIALNTGIGVRFDFNFFIFRLDWGIKLHNPNRPVGKEWIQKFRYSDTALNFGVGYPF